MSNARPEDHQRTQAILNGSERFRDVEPNWLNHTKQAALIDKMLLGKGSTIEEISSALSVQFGKGVRPPRAFDSRVKFHLGHLEKEVRSNNSEQDPHGLPLFRNTDGRIGFVRDHGVERAATQPQNPKKVAMPTNLENPGTSEADAISTGESISDDTLILYQKRLEEVLERSGLGSLGSETEVEAIVRRRVGQDVFRASLMDYWDGRCAVTGIAVPELLRASHCKDWALCESDAERLNVFNGLLLSAHLDALYDAKLMTFDGGGTALFSNRIDSHTRASLGLVGPLRLSRIDPRHLPFLRWHRERFEGNVS